MYKNDPRLSISVFGGQITEFPDILEGKKDTSQIGHFQNINTCA